MIRFIHSADWQIGRSFAGMADDTAARLRAARVEVVDRIGQIAAAEQASFVLVAGDVYDSEDLSSTTLLAPLERMRRYPQVRWYLLPGNHDPHRPDRIWDRLLRLGLPENIRPVLTAEPVQDPAGAWLLPAPLTRRASSADPTEALDRMPTPAGGVRIGLAHGSIRSFGEAEADLRAAIAPDRAERAGLSYLALGDWHRCRQIDQRTWYSGTPEPDRFGSAGELVDGCVVSVSVDGPAALPKAAPVASAQYQWAALTGELYQTDDIRALDTKIRAIADHPARLLVRLHAGGSLGLEDFAAFEVAIDQGLRAALLDLEINLDALRVSPSALDFEAIDRSGTALRQVAEQLGDRAASSNQAEAATAARALNMLYGFAQLSAPDEN